MRDEIPPDLPLVLLVFGVRALTIPLDASHRERAAIGEQHVMKLDPRGV